MNRTEKKYKVAAVQMSTTIGDVKGNVAKAKAMAEEAISQGARLVCFPEMFNTGYFSHTTHADTGFLDLGESLEDSTTLREMGELARKSKVWMLAPIVERAEQGIYYNTSVLIDDRGEVFGRYRKVHVPWSLTAWEKFYFRPGYEYPVFDTPLGKLGVQTCYDRDFPEGFRTLALDGAQVVLVPAGAPRSLASLWKHICIVRGYENGVFLVGIGMTGKADDEHHELVAHSLVVSPAGEVLASVEDEETVLVSDIDLEDIERARRKRFVLRDRRPETYSRVTELR